MVLLTVLRKIQRKEKQVRVLVLGLDNAGKSTIVSRALERPVTDVHPTLGFQIETIEHNGLTLNVWDVGGQRSLRPFWHNYFEKTDFLVWVVDATAPERLQSCCAELHEALQTEEDRLVGAGLLIWINKLDAIPENEREAVVARTTEALDLDNKALSDHHQFKVVGCSAYTGEGIQDGLDFIVHEAKERLFVLDY